MFRLLLTGWVFWPPQSPPLVFMALGGSLFSLEGNEESRYFFLLLFWDEDDDDVIKLSVDELAKSLGVWSALEQQQSSLDSFDLSSLSSWSLLALLSFKSESASFSLLLFLSESLELRRLSCLRAPDAVSFAGLFSVNVLAKLLTPEVVEPVVRLGAMDGSGERVEVRDVDKSEVSKLELALSLKREIK